MGDERESSGSGTVTIVAIILAVVLLVPCCGIVVVFAGGFMWVGTSIQPAPPQQAIDMPAEMIQIQDKAVQDMVDQAKQMEAISEEADKAGRPFEQAIPSVPSTEAIPAEGEVPSSVDKTPEEEK